MQLEELFVETEKLIQYIRALRIAHVYSTRAVLVIEFMDMVMQVM